ncbi:MAG: UDP-N-acetylmuramoyl-tripeptide--D-alanyl-D-alanine ligase [Chloroflexota bacterium]
MLDVATVIRATCARVVQVLPDGRYVHASLARAELAQRLEDVCIDSRQAGQESLFFALKGERVDGHAFVAAAFARGARACVVDHMPEETHRVSEDDSVKFLFVVPDVLSALQDLARYWRLKHDLRMIGITGSVGKTTTKEIIASVLSFRFAVLRSDANLNTEIGVPLVLLRIRPWHQVAVVEMGMYVPGDIALLANIARPNIGVVTNVAGIHLERAGSIEQIARGKSELPAAIQSDGLVVLNGDDPWTSAMASASGVAPVITTGTGQPCDFRAMDVEARGLAGLQFTMCAEGHRFAVRTHVPGAHLVHAFLMSAAVARRAGLEWDEVLHAMAEVRLQTRQNIVHADRGVVVIDDTYNASPPSVAAALRLLSGCAGERIAVLGDMLELGPGEREAHREIGALVAAHCDFLLAVGPRGGWIADGAIDAGMPPSRVRRAGSSADAVSSVHAIVEAIPVADYATASLTMQRPDSGRPVQVDNVRCSVLVKGSRAMKMEQVVHGLLRST